ncbi:nuclear transport factor 2 family protein [Nesterenkonia sp. PF2B19]|uniref:nuclear transport factor 2 family protein n=1 Tax=Nesterenkonia sp. PF2B19 TaxID=1881858 RepID=UPI000872DB42|nr:nuclear transport factor 2 family protein [Nesterenkonia sp. PF2B19]OSM42289.1 hypothetical protein BCY76_015205 [Nesterenkonia sp. PF2B19]
MADTADLARNYLSHLTNREWDAWSALLHPDVIYTTPQSRERRRGREAFLRFNQEYPGDWQLTEKWVLGDTDRAVIWFAWTVGDDCGDAQSFLSFDDSGRITEITEFWPEPYDDPDRATPATERF